MKNSEISSVGFVWGAAAAKAVPTTQSTGLHWFANGFILFSQQCRCRCRPLPPVFQPFFCFVLFIVFNGHRTVSAIDSTAAVLLLNVLCMINQIDRFECETFATNKYSLWVWMVHQIQPNGTRTRAKPFSAHSFGGRLKAETQNEWNICLSSFVQLFSLYFAHLRSSAMTKLRWKWNGIQTVFVWIDSMVDWNGERERQFVYDWGNWYVPFNVAHALPACLPACACASGWRPVN